MKATFNLYKGNDSQYYFNLKASNHEIIGQSEGYTTKASALNGIESVRSNSPTNERYSVYQDRAGEYRFNLRAANHEIILQSEGYTVRSSAIHGIESVKKNAHLAELIDKTTKEAPHEK